MNKKIFILTILSFVGLTYIYLKSAATPVAGAKPFKNAETQAQAQLQLQSKAQSEAQAKVNQASEKFLIENATHLQNLTDAQLKQKLQLLNLKLESSKFKNYSDFSEQDLHQYNQQVRESVKIKKLLFFRKYAQRSRI